MPAGERAAALTREVITLNASTDPQLRDGVGYEAFVTWVYRDQLLTAAELRSLLPPLLAAAGAGLGEAHGDGIFARSFALLDGRALRCRGDDAAPEAELLAR